MNAPILAPAAALVAWSLIVLFWMAATRFPAMFKAGLHRRAVAPGGRGQDLEGLLPANVMWKAHNFTHLMEQPTIFYATVTILALSEAGTGTNVMLAWSYVGLRILHSLWQGLVNTVPIRLSLFLLSTGVLAALAVNAVRATLGAA